MIASLGARGIIGPARACAIRLGLSWCALSFGIAARRVARQLESLAKPLLECHPSRLLIGVPWYSSQKWFWKSTPSFLTFVIAGVVSDVGTRGLQASGRPGASRSGCDFLLVHRGGCQPSTARANFALPTPRTARSCASSLRRPSPRTWVSNPRTARLSQPCSDNGRRRN